MSASPLTVVSDASPILNLAAVDKIHILRDLYTEIIVPATVEQELARNGFRLHLPWAHVVAARDQQDVALLCKELDRGEAESIVIAAEIGADLVLMDERRGRKIALDRGLKVTGLLGVLAEAKERGLIDRCQPLLDDMIRRAGFWISSELRTRYLQSLNEWP